MGLWNPLNAPAYLASLTWRQHLRTTIPLCIWELFCIYLGTGYYIKIEIAHDPDYIKNTCVWILWLVGSEGPDL